MYGAKLRALAVAVLLTFVVGGCGDGSGGAAASATARLTFSSGHPEVQSATITNTGTVEWTLSSLSVLGEHFSGEDPNRCERRVFSPGMRCSISVFHETARAGDSGTVNWIIAFLGEKVTNLAS